MQRPNPVEAYTVVKQLLLPPGIILVLLAIAFLLVRGTLGRLLLFVAWSLLLLMSLPGLAVPFIGTLERYPALDPDRLAELHADAIVVLGAGVYSDAPEYGGHTVSGNSLRASAMPHGFTIAPACRCMSAAEPAIWHPGPAMVQVLKDEYGVPVAGLERDSHNTRENAELTAPMLRADGVHRVLLVTQAWHMPRAVEAFERAGVDVVAAPTYFITRDAKRPNQTGAITTPTGYRKPRPFSTAITRCMN
jgi:uncharacterized SAM-binding protein YcdF (DUF218 family)